MENKKLAFVGNLAAQVLRSKRFEKEKPEPKLLMRLHFSVSRIQPFRKPERSVVNEALLKWFKQQRSDTVPLSGPLLMIIFVLPDF